MSEENRFHGLAAGAMNIAAGVALLASLYLLWGIVFGHLDAATATAGAKTVSADAERLIHNFSLASSALGLSLGLFALLAAFVYFTDTAIAYLLVSGAAVIGFGVPYLLTFFVPATADATLLQKSAALRTALGAFPVASVLPGVIGLLMVGKDIFLRFGDLSGGRETLVSEMSFGGDAQRAGREKRPMRTGILAKCWEGPYCRENIRPHCPVYIAKGKCWTKKSGCYCDEDIIRTAIQKIEGTLLPMAPDPKFNFSNASLQGVGRQLPQYKKELSWGEKKERCRNCVIYNEHQREKYQFALPATLLASIGGFWLLLPVMRSAMAAGLKSGFAFVQNATPAAAHAQSANPVTEAGASFTAAGTAVGFGPDPILVWVLTIAFGVVALAKILTWLEWAIFEKKI